MGKVILITGGERSGKSEEAEQRALRLSSQPVYMATSRVLDDEMRQRVALHRQRRGSQWTNIEEDLWLSRHELTGRVVLVDCLTLWLTNFFLDMNDAAKALQTAKEEFDRLVAQDATFIIVTNEIGMGGISPDRMQRQFTDLQGWMNQHVAQRADEVILMVSGLPLIIKQ